MEPQTSPSGKKTRTLWERLQRNVKRAVTRPFKPKKEQSFPADDIEDLMDFTGLSREALLPYLQRRRGYRISDEFDWLTPASGDEYGWFYRGSRTYVFHAGEAWQDAVDLAQPGMRILDFGGGAGRNSLAMAAQGAEVHFVDIGVQTSAFVAFRARKRALNVHVIDPMVEVDGCWQVDTAEAARRVGGFDLVVCDNVLEHVPDYHLVLKKLAGGLKPGGRILECTPFKREKVYLFKREGDWDIHLKPTKTMAEAMADCGLRRVDPERTDRGLWIKDA